jgi:phosphate starvation-inducible PhoH-like protein
LETTIQLPQETEQRLAATGVAERNLKLIREALGVQIAARNESVRISGPHDAVARAVTLIQRLSKAAAARRPLQRHELLQAIAEVAQAPHAAAAAPADGHGEGGGAAAGPSGERLSALDQLPAGGDGFDVYLRGRRILAKTAGQRAYLEAIRGHDLTFCCGPAGTGKTYLATAAAVSMLKHGIVRKLVLVRPAVEAGEKLGFLPGGMQEKVNPYLRPLLDALHDMMEYDQIQRLMACDLIEIIPLAFMRGRTLNDAAIILDEAQNTTRQQMMMFLTRMGQGAKMVVTGDTSQIDLEDPRDSGLVDAVRRLRRVGGIAFVTLDKHDIVRHSLVQKIVEAYAPREGTAAQS